MKRVLISCVTVTLALGGLQARFTWAAGENFYQGKTIKFLIGADAGGGYDLYARAVARFLPNHIPGKPTVVPTNMPGAASANAAASLYNNLPHDGTAIAALSPSALVGPLLESRYKHRYDPEKFNYLASADSSIRLCITWGPSKVKTFRDAMRESATMGASAPGAPTANDAYMHVHATGAKFKLVTGYQGTGDIFLAMQKGELDGLCGIALSSLKSQRPDWLRDKKINILDQYALKPDPELTKMGVPSVSEFIKNPADKAAVDLIVSEQIFSKPYVAPPGIPAEQLAILRKGFADTLADPAFLALTKSERLAVVPISGEEVQADVAKVYESSAATVARAKELVAP